MALVLTLAACANDGVTLRYGGVRREDEGDIDAVRALGESAPDADLFLYPSNQRPRHRRAASAVGSRGSRETLTPSRRPQ